MAEPDVAQVDAVREQSAAACPGFAAPRAGERCVSHLVSGGVDGGSDPVVLMP